MALSNHEGSLLTFSGLKGIFDVRAPKLTAGWLPGLPFSGVMAEAVQSVAITSRIAAENLLAVGYKGHAGYSKRFGGVDVNIDAVLTDNVNVSGAYGYDLSDFENQIFGNLVLYTTNGQFGRAVTVSGLYVNSVSFSFNQNDNSTTSWSFVGDGLTYSGYTVATDGSKGFIDYHCVNPLTWDEIHIYDQKNSVILTGVQTATFSATLSRTDTFQIGQFTPYDRAVQHPYNVTVSLNTLANDVALVNWWQKFVPSYDPMSDCADGLVIKVRTNPIANAATTTPRDFIIASGLRPDTGTLNVAVGSNSTVSLNFAGTSLRF